MIRPGDCLGAYEVVARLGAGGQGEVFLARPLSNASLHVTLSRTWLRACLAAGLPGAAEARRHRLAALKLAYHDTAASLHDEHSHLSRTDATHPHLPRLYGRRYPGQLRDFGLMGGRVYMALAYEPGISLERLLARRQRLPVAWSITVAAQVGHALAHLHQRGILHHDVRPANVVVRHAYGGTPHAVLIDLGAAETPGSPRRRAVYGTVGHLPPERLLPTPAPATPLVDVFGLGVLLRELTAGSAGSPALSELVALATAPEPLQRAAELPSVEAALERLYALPEARGLQRSYSTEQNA